MSKTVGLPTARGGPPLLRGEIPLTGAAIPTHASIYGPTLKELERRGLRFTETVEDIRRNPEEQGTCIMSNLELGVVATARKPDERRLPIHPTTSITSRPELRPRIHFEQGYGEPFGVSDQTIGNTFGSVRPRVRPCSRTSSCFRSPSPTICANCARERFTGDGRTAYSSARSPTWPSNASSPCWPGEAMFTWRGEVRRASPLLQEQRNGRVLRGSSRLRADR